MVFYPCGKLVEDDDRAYSGGERPTTVSYSLFLVPLQSPSDGQSKDPPLMTITGKPFKNGLSCNQAL